MPPGGSCKVARRVSVVFLCERCCIFYLIFCAQHLWKYGRRSNYSERSCHVVIERGAGCTEKASAPYPLQTMQVIRRMQMLRCLQG